MNTLNHFNLPFRELTEGKHQFEFIISDWLFDQYDNDFVEGGDGKCIVKVSKVGEKMELEVEISAKIKAICDRCLNICEIPIYFEDSVDIEGQDERTEQDYRTDAESQIETIIVWRGEKFINLTQYIYDSLILNLPYQLVHEVDKNGLSLCDPDMLARFESITQTELEQLEVRVAEDNIELDDDAKNKLAALKVKLETGQ